MVSGGEHKTKKVLLRNDRVHPSIARAVEIIKKDWEQLCLKDQDILGSPKQWSKVLALIGDDDLRSDLGDEDGEGEERGGQVETFLAHFLDQLFLEGGT